MDPQRTIAIVTEGMDPFYARLQPWYFYKTELAEAGYDIHSFHGNDPQVFDRPFDGMLLYVWQHWENPERFDVNRIFPILEKQIEYRARYPETIQIVVNHTDMARKPFATPFWRPEDPIFFRTPSYDRSELFPFPADRIWPYEMVWGRSAFRASEKVRYRAGFIGQPSGPSGYRKAVAKAVAKVGVSHCEWGYRYSQEKHDSLMSECEIIVCPQGWGENSVRHWDAWLSGKPVLTDEACHSVEMIPGVRLQENVHYLVYRSPDEIPDIVSDWTRPGKRDDLLAVAKQGKEAALSYNPLQNFLSFLKFAFTAPKCLSTGYQKKTSPLFSETLT